MLVLVLFSGATVTSIVLVAGSGFGASIINLAAGIVALAL